MKTTENFLGLFSAMGIAFRITYTICLVVITIALYDYLSANALTAQWETIWYQYNMQDMLYEQEDDGTKFTPVFIGFGARGI